MQYRLDIMLGYYYSTNYSALEMVIILKSHHTYILYGQAEEITDLTR